LLLALLALLRPDLLRGAWREAMGSLRGDTIGLRMAVSPRDHEGKALAAFLDAHPDFDVTTVESDTPASSMGLLRSGNADLAVLPAVLPPGGGNVERVALGSAGARLLHMLAPADSGLNSYAQLAGKRVGGGLPGSVEATLLESLFAAIPLNPPAKLVTGHNLDLEQAFLDGEIDAGAVIRPLPSPEVTGLIATGYYRLLSVSVGAAGIWSLPAAFLASIPAQVYTAPGSGTTAENPVPTLGLDMLVYTRPDLAHGVAGSLATTLAAALERNGMVGISGRNALAGLPPEVHLHPGAAAAYRSMAPWTWDDAALLTWMLCGLAVLTLLGMRALQYRETRLHRQRASLVTHFALRARALELAFAEAPDEKRDALRRELLDLDEQAEAAWLSGRLDASDILMLRLGWSAELPERSTEELRARALEIPAAASPVRPSREAAPAMLHVPTSMPPTVTPVPARDLEPDTHEDEPSDFVPEETEFARPLPRQPEAAPQATDEYGSGALLNTIRVRKRIEDDLDEPPAQPEPLPRVADAKQDASIRVKQKEPKRGPDSAKRGARKEPAARNERAPAKPPAPPRETPPQDADGGKPQLPLF
jgi:TRAP-type uncharacterized transport system substrate-binding protein